MGRYKYVFDEQRVQKFLAEGRGQGSGADYLPWLKIQDLPSRGRSHRPYGIKTGRVHHLLSDGEWKCFLKFEADPRVGDIREQFPMNRLMTYMVAQELGCRHPVTLDGTPYVMTIDFLVTYKVGSQLQLQPYTFKYDPDTLKPREQELIDIASGFWEKQGYRLEVIDQSFFDEALVINYDAVRSFFDISHLDFYHKTNVVGIADAIRQGVNLRLRETLGLVCQALAHDFQTESKVVFSIAKHLIARGGLLVNFSSPISLEQMLLCEFEAVPQKSRALSWY